MANPYIVKENDPYTIKKFVTGKPLDEETRTTPDEHGIYPVSPLGFLYEEVDEAPQPVPSVEYGSNPSNVADVYNKISPNVYTLATTPSILSGTCPSFSIQSMSYVGGQYVIKVDGDIREVDDTMATAYIRNASDTNDYSSLGILESVFDITWEEGGNCIYNAEDGITTVITSGSVDWRLTGTVGAGRLLLGVLKFGKWSLDSVSGRYVRCLDTGIVYETGSSDSEPFSRRLRYSTEESTESSELYTESDLVSTDYDCNGKSHIRNGYSDKEVMEWVEGKVGGITASGTHPSSREGNITNSGALVQWFVSTGNVDISGGINTPVIVNGFGLGAGFFGDVKEETRVVEDKPRFTDDGEKVDYTVPDEKHSHTNGTIETGFVYHPPVGHPTITFGYGTNHNAKVEDGTSTLPMDWPFSSNTRTDTNNNITFPGSEVNITEQSVAHGKVVGGLINAKTYDLCPDCGGMGYVNGNMCTKCNGTGDVNPSRVDINRAHICLFNDFTANGDDDTAKGYKKDTTVLKKTFIHLAAPLDTEDGTEYEITVSLPNVNTKDAFNTGDKVKDLSAYYAYVSQPRVYVLSGTWKFSNMKLNVTDPESETSHFVKGNGVFLDSAGEPVEVGTSVRFELHSNRMTPHNTEFEGKLVLNSADTGYSIEFDGPYPYDVGGRGWYANDMYVCGLTYLDDADEEYSNPTDKSMGIITRSDAMLNDFDYGEGADGTLDNYNKFYTLDSKEGRKKLSDHIDNRYVVATVYPTATNTFPWAIAGRRKVSHMDRLLTSEADFYGSVLDIAWKANYNLLRLNTSVKVPEHEGDDYSKWMSDRDNMLTNIGWDSNECNTINGWSVDNSLISYAKNDWATAESAYVDKNASIIGRMLRIGLPKTLKLPATEFTGYKYNVVQRAADSVKELVDDFCKLRLRYEANARTGNTYLPANDDTDKFVWNTSMFTSEASTPEVPDEGFALGEIWRMRMRHVPGYIYEGETDIAENMDRYSMSGIYPFDGATNVRDVYRKINEARYTTDFVTTGDTEDEPCDISSAPAVEEVYHSRSVIRRLLETRVDFAGYIYYTDILRIAEAQFAEIDDSVMHPYIYRYDRSSEKYGVSELMDAYTKIVSVDGVPSPDPCMTLGDVLPLLSEPQRAYVGGDAFASYRFECDDAEVESDFDFVSNVLPTSDSALSQFLRTYTPCYAAKLPTRVWDGNRVFVPKGGISNVTDANRVVYYRRIKWLGEMLDQCEDSIKAKMNYANDMFARSSAAPNTQDLNISWHTVDNGLDEIYLESNCSIPPGTMADGYRTFVHGFSDEDTAYSGEESTDANTYIRVFMKFVFSSHAGRWYCVDYRQTPVSYLSPLYGAKALDSKKQSIYDKDGAPAELYTDEYGYLRSKETARIWTDSVCGGYSWTDATRHPYYMYPPMNINNGVVPFCFYSLPYDSDGNIKETGPGCVPQENDAPMRNTPTSLIDPWRPAENGGLGLLPPLDCHGEAGWMYHWVKRRPTFWSVREHIRPAVSVIGGSAIPGVRIDEYTGDTVHERTGGTMSDPTLWGQFDYPRRGEVKYHMPDPEYPLEDMLADHYLIFKDNIGTGNIQSGSHEDIAYTFKK